MAYSVVTQLAPALYFSLMKNNFVNKYGAGAGMIVGVVIVAYVTATNITMPQLFPSFPQWIQDLNIGLIALLLNIIVTVIVSLVMGKSAATSQGNNETATLQNN